VALEDAWSILKAGAHCHADAVILPNNAPFGYQIKCPICDSGPHTVQDKNAADRCNHADSPCGHTLRIDPNKPCKGGCERGGEKQPEKTEEPPPEEGIDYSEFMGRDW
jgi:hypothetical protein